MAERPDGVEPKIEVDKLNVHIDKLITLVQGAPFHPDHKEKVLSHLNRAKHHHQAIHHVLHELELALAVVAALAEGPQAYSNVHNTIQSLITNVQEEIFHSSPPRITR